MNFSFFAPDRHSAVWWATVIFLLGLAIRVGLALPGAIHGPRATPEPVRIASSLVATGAFSDAYGAGSGPSAHCSPLYPLLLALLFRIFGTGPAGYIAMTLLGCAGAAATFALLPLLAQSSGLPMSAGVIGGLAGALLPVNFWTQTNGTFEAPFTALLMMVMCVMIGNIWRRGRFTAAEGALFGAVAGIGFLMSSGLIPVVAALFAVSCIRFRKRIWQVLACAAAGACCVAIILLPWAVRNRITLGSFLWTRSNFGLELQLSNNDLSSADDELNVRTQWWQHAHPGTDDGERARVRALGEIAYHRAKGLVAKKWISTHPQRFLVLTAQRFRLVWFPAMSRVTQSIAEAGLTLLALAGLVLLFRKRQDCAWIAAAVLISYPAVYYIIEVSPRYRFPIEPLLFLLAAVPFAALRPYAPNGELSLR